MIQAGHKRILGALLAAVLCCLTVLPALPKVSAQDSLNLASEAVVLMDAETGQVLYEKNMHKQMYPASITKIMTGLIALKTLDPGQMLTVSQAAVDAVPITSSHISLRPGEQLMLDQAMYAIGMESANDAANVLAEAVSGSLAEFAQRMNEEAYALGAYNTHFTNANGLPDSRHCTTAYDMALITAAALKQPGFNTYFSTVEYLFPATNLSDARAFANKDRLLPGAQYDYGGVLMAKTGWTTAAQGTFAAAVKRGETTLIVITLKSPMLEDKYKDTHKLLDYGFSHFTRAIITGEDMASQLILDQYFPIAEQDFPFLLPEGTTPSDIAFSLEAGTGLIERDGRLCVSVTAALGDLLMPNQTLYLQEEGEEALPLPAVPVLAEDAAEPELPAPPRHSFVIYLVLAAAVLILGIAVRNQRRRRLRRERRRQLAARIRRMKKQMQ